MSLMWDNFKQPFSFIFAFLGLWSGLHWKSKVLYEKKLLLNHQNLQPSTSFLKEKSLFWYVDTEKLNFSGIATSVGNVCNVIFFFWSTDLLGYHSYPLFSSCYTRGGHLNFVGLFYGFGSETSRTSSECMKGIWYMDFLHSFHLDIKMKVLSRPL